MLKKLLIFAFFVSHNLTKATDSINASSSALNKLGSFFDSLSNVADKLIDKTSKTKEKLRESDEKFKEPMSQGNAVNAQPFLNHDNRNYDNRKLSNGNFRNAPSATNIPKLKQSPQQVKINNKSSFTIKRSNLVVSPKSLPQRPNVPYNLGVNRKK